MWGGAPQARVPSSLAMLTTASSFLSNVAKPRETFSGRSRRRADKRPARASVQIGRTRYGGSPQFKEGKIHTTLKEKATIKSIACVSRPPFSPATKRAQRRATLTTLHARRAIEGGDETKAPTTEVSGGGGPRSSSAWRGVHGEVRSQTNLGPALS